MTYELTLVPRVLSSHDHVEPQLAFYFLTDMQSESPTPVPASHSVVEPQLLVTRPAESGEVTESKYA